MSRPQLIVFASGTKDGGGSGFENLVVSPDLDADMCAVVSNHEFGGVRSRAERLGIPFVYFPGPFTKEGYASVLQKTGIESNNSFTALSGWLKKVVGLNPAHTFNIHPALLSFDGGRFGGPGHYGLHVHEAVKKALDAGEITDTGFTMHFVTDEYDRGPAFFEYRVPLHPGMSVEKIAAAVNKAEHEWQPKITNMVVRGEIQWNGHDIDSLVVPDGYEYFPKKL